MATFAQIAIGIDARPAEEGAKAFVDSGERIIETTRGVAREVERADEAVKVWGRDMEAVSRRAAGGDFGLGAGGAGAIDPLRQRVAAIRRATAQQALLDRYDPEAPMRARQRQIEEEVRRTAERAMQMASAQRQVADAMRDSAAAADRAFNPFQRMDGILGAILRKSPFILAADVTARVAGFGSLLEAVNAGLNAMSESITNVGKTLAGQTPLVEEFNAALEAQRALVGELDKAATSASKRSVDVAFLKEDSFLGRLGPRSFERAKYQVDLGIAAGTREGELALAGLMTRIESVNRLIREGFYGTDQDRQRDAVKLAFDDFERALAGIVDRQEEAARAQDQWNAKLAAGAALSKQIEASFRQRERDEAMRSINERLSRSESFAPFVGRLIDRTIIGPAQERSEASMLAEANRVGREAYERARSFDAEAHALAIATARRREYNRELADTVLKAGESLVQRFVTDPLLGGIDRIKSAQDSLGGLLSDLQFESTLIGKSSEERERAIILREAEARAMGLQSDTIADLLRKIEQESKRADIARKLEEEIRKLEALSQTASRSIATSFEDAAIDAQRGFFELRDLIQSIIFDIERMFIRRSFTQPFQEWLESLFSGWLGGGGGGGTGSSGSGGDLDLPDTGGGGGSSKATSGGGGGGGTSVIVQQSITVNVNGGAGWTPRAQHEFRKSTRQAAEDARAILSGR